MPSFGKPDLAAANVFHCDGAASPEIVIRGLRSPDLYQWGQPVIGILVDDDKFKVAHLLLCQTAQQNSEFLSAIFGPHNKAEAGHIGSLPMTAVPQVVKWENRCRLLYSDSKGNGA